MMLTDTPSLLSAVLDLSGCYNIIPEEVRQTGKPVIRINPRFVSWQRHEILPPKYECTGSGSSGTGNTRNESYIAWSREYAHQERVRRERYSRSQYEAMANATSSWHRGLLL